MPSTSDTTMPTTAAIPTREGGTRPLGTAAFLILYAALLWPALAGGAHGGWPLVITELLVLVGLLAWWLAMADAGQLEWYPTTLDKPLALLVALVLLQLVIGNGPLREWALAPPVPGPATFPTRFLFLGTVSPAQTGRSLLLLLAYTGVYLLVVNLVRQRQQLDRFVRMLLGSGAVLASLYRGVPPRRVLDLPLAQRARDAAPHRPLRESRSLGLLARHAALPRGGLSRGTAELGVRAAPRRDRDRPPLARGHSAAVPSASRAHADRSRRRPHPFPRGVPRRARGGRALASLAFAPPPAHVGLRPRGSARHRYHHLCAVDRRRPSPRAPHPRGAGGPARAVAEQRPYARDLPPARGRAWSVQRNLLPLPAGGPPPWPRLLPVRKQRSPPVRHRDGPCGRSHRSVGDLAGDARSRGRASPGTWALPRGHRRSFAAQRSFQRRDHVGRSHRRGCPRCAQRGGLFRAHPRRRHPRRGLSRHRHCGCPHALRHRRGPHTRGHPPRLARRRAAAARGSRRARRPPRRLRHSRHREAGAGRHRNGSRPRAPAGNDAPALDGATRYRGRAAR